MSNFNYFSLKINIKLKEEKYEDRRKKLKEIERKIYLLQISSNLFFLFLFFLFLF